MSATTLDGISALDRLPGGAGAARGASELRADPDDEH